MIQIRKEAEEIIQGKQPKDNNILKNAPHPISVMMVSDAEWNRCVPLDFILLSRSDRYADLIHDSKLHTPRHGSMKRNSGPLFHELTMVSPLYKAYQDYTR